MHKFAETVKHYWPVVTAFIFVFGVMFAAVNYYARAEAESLIDVKMEQPLKDLNSKYNNIEQKSRSIEHSVKVLRMEQMRQNDVNTEKFKGVNRRLDTIIKLLDK